MTTSIVICHRRIFIGIFHRDMCQLYMRIAYIIPIFRSTFSVERIYIMNIRRDEVHKYSHVSDC